MSPRRLFGPATTVGRFLEAAEPVFFAVSQALAVALAILVFCVLQVRFLPQQWIEDISDEQYAAYVLSDAALLSIGAGND